MDAHLILHARRFVEWKDFFSRFNVWTLLFQIKLIMPYMALKMNYWKENGINICPLIFRLKQKWWQLLEEGTPRNSELHMYFVVLLLYFAVHFITETKDLFLL